MTNAELIQAIRNEIEKQRDKYCYGSSTLHLNISKDFAELLSFLDTLEESEKPMNQEGLEEEIAGMYQALFGTDIINRKEMLYLDTFEAIARHFAQWGAENLKK